MRSAGSLFSILAASSALVATSTATAGTAPPAAAGSCSALLAPQPAKRTPFTVSGQTVDLRDPYGGQVTRNRLFIAFALSYPTPAARAAVSSVQWQVDGQAYPTMGTGPAQALNFSSLRLAVGPHVVTATVTPSDGSATVQASTTVTATDCQVATVFPDLVNGKTTQPAGIQVSGGGPALTAVSISASGLRAALPAKLAGRKVGTLKLASVNGPDIDQTLKTLTLRAPKAPGSGSVLLARQGSTTVRLHPGTTGSLLSIAGLPSTTQAVTLSTATGVLSVVKACPLPILGVRLTGGTGAAVTVTSGIDISKNC